MTTFIYSNGRTGIYSPLNGLDPNELLAAGQVEKVIVREDIPEEEALLYYYDAAAGDLRIKQFCFTTLSADRIEPDGTDKASIAIQSDEPIAFHVTVYNELDESTATYVKEPEDGVIRFSVTSNMKSYIKIEPLEEKCVFTRHIEINAGMEEPENESYHIF